MFKAKFSSAFVLGNVVWHCAYDTPDCVYMQVFPDKARRREVRFIKVHCDDARCSWTGNAGELEVPIFFRASPTITMILCVVNDTP